LVTGGPQSHISWLTDDTGQKAVLKIARDRSEKKLIEPFNELVCYRLASVVGTSTTKVCLERVGEEPAVISIVKSELNFSYVQANNVNLTTENVQFMANLLVVDWWLGNTDRPRGKNEHLIIIKTDSGITLCPIDYSHALSGCSGEIFTMATVTDPNRIGLANYNHISETYIQDFTQLEPMVRQVAAIQDQVIVSIVDDVVARVSEGRPENEIVVLRSNAEVVKALLKYRRDGLTSTLKEWCRLKGKAEARP